MVVVLKDCDDWILSNTISNNNLARPGCTDDNRCCINQGAMGSRINTTFGWGDDDNIGTSHDVLLFGDQHEMFGTTVCFRKRWSPIGLWCMIRGGEYVSHDNTL